MIMKWILLLALLSLSSTAYAQDTYEFQHIPEGVVIVHEGVEYMAYDIDTFREIARVDNGYSMCLALREEDAEEIRQMQSTLSALRALDERQQALVDDVHTSLERIEEESASEQPGFWHPIHTPIELVLLAVAGWAIAN